MKALDRDAVYFGGWLTSHIGIFGTITISNDEGRRLSSFNNYIIPGGNLQQFALEVYNKTHIWTGGSRWPRSSFTNYLVFTHDSGATWHEPEVQFPSTITAIAFADAQHGLVGDVKGDIYITHDGGYTWTLDYKATEPLKINDIDIYGNTIIAGTDRSQILRRTVPVSVHYPSPPTTLSTYSVYPNPSTGTVHISLDADFSNISVFDILGNVVLNVSSGSLTSNPVTLDLSRFPSGMYRVVVRSDYGMQSESVVKL